MLVVEDDIATGELLVEAINDLPGYRAAYASSPAQAFTIVEQVVPDVLVIDVELPEMSGVDLYDSLRRDDRTRTVPVIFETAHGPSHVEHLRRAGVASYVSKPFDLREVLRYVRHLAPPRPFDQLATN